MDEAAGPKRRWYQYSLRTLLLFVLACSLICSCVAVMVKREKEATSSNNVKQIGLIFQNYASAMDGCFPACASFDNQGKLLLSWRVHVDPYSCSGLRDQFHLDEPWDSAHNKQFIPRWVPHHFRSPNSAVRPGTTPYLGVVGEGMMFEGTKARHMADIKDGHANTIMVVEADDDRAVIWTKPEDWEYDPQQPLAGLGHAAGGRLLCPVRRRQRAVHLQNIDPETFHAMLTIAGGEQVTPDR